jgi:hypothetical protein
MSLKVQASFSAGELDPALRERTTLQKYHTGLATARNVVVGKTGRLISRPGRRHVTDAKVSGTRIKIHPMPYLGGFLEWGHLHCRWYDNDGNIVDNVVTTYTEDDLETLRFVDLTETINGSINYILGVVLHGTATQFLLLEPTLFFFGTVSFGDKIGAAPSFVASSSTGTGHAVDYAFTYIKDGVESNIFEYSALGINLPVLAGELNNISVKLITGVTNNITTVNVYRRPASSGGYGFVGTGRIHIVGADIRSQFIDVGQAADYTHQPPSFTPTIVNEGLSGPGAFLSKTGALYQRRLLLSYTNKIESSRTEYFTTFYRDYPYDSASGLSFGPETEILHMIDSNGLVVFTTEGVFLSLGPLGPTNITLDKKGNWVIDDIVPPIAIPGGVLFIDSKTNTVRELAWSEENGSYTGEELSIFSDHLFKGIKISSWAFQDGDLPLLWVVYANGTYSSFTYEKNQKMKAWTRHDSGYGVEYVAAMRDTLDFSSTWPYNRTDGDVIFVTNKDGDRFIEMGVPRYVSAQLAVDDPESDKGESIAAMDAMVSWSHMILDDLTTQDMILTPVTPGVWDEDLTLSITVDSIFTDPGIGAVGTVFRHFNPDDRTTVDLTVTARASDKSLTVSPNTEFPSGSASSPRLYEAVDTFTGLDHLDGESVSVVCDGYVISSPNNDIQNYAVSTPAAGSLTLTDKWAIVHIGRPFTSDIETLDVDTVEQGPTLIESITCNKVYIRVHETRGVNIGNNFPDNDKVKGMSAADDRLIDYEDTIPIIANRYEQPVNKRVEMTIPGDWRSQGRVCIRNVDPVHFEILSIIPDLDIQRRGR